MTPLTLRRVLLASRVRRRRPGAPTSLDVLAWGLFVGAAFGFLVHFLNLAMRTI